MKTKQQIIDAYASSNKQSGCIDGRDAARLADFFSPDEWHILGVKPTDKFDPDKFTPLEWTEENILAQLEKDVEFAFEKALGQRGLSAGLMHDVVKMWMWVLDDTELQDFDEYAQYGLPLFKKVAVKYGFNNPIGEDYGNEGEYGLIDWD